MPDLETSVRRLLDDRAASVPAASPRPPAVLRRARVRRVRSGAGAGLLVVATLLGGSAALSRMAADDSTTDVISEPPPSVLGTTPSTLPPTPDRSGPIPVPTTSQAGPVSVPTTRPATTVARPTTTAVTTPPAVYVDGVPQVAVTPGRGAPATRVQLDGYGFTDQQWQGPGKALWLAGSGGCGVTAQAEHDIRVTPDGHLTGSFVVPARGQCPQSDVADAPVTAGRYRIAFSCTACVVGEFEVTIDPSAGAPCANVGFTPDSDDVASSIVAHNMGCPEAEALVRKVGQPLGPVNGAPTAEADGFRCVRTGQDDDALPMAFYECTNGAKRVEFTRT
jgi:hypothetical protein